MSIYEAVGGCFVIYMTCVGVYVHGLAVYKGVIASYRRNELGQTYEDSAVREYLGAQVGRGTIRIFRSGE